MVKESRNCAMFEGMKRRQVIATALLLIGVVLLIGGCAEMARSRGMYTCPMHPEEKSESPGQCPICKMDLKPMGSSVKSGGSSYSAGSHMSH